MAKIKIYNLRIVPPNPIFKEISQFKRQFEAVFGNQPLSKSKPHITLAAFRMDSDYQDILLKIFNQLSSVEEFKLEIQGFGIFENNSNVLYLKVSKTQEIEQILGIIKVMWIRDLHRKLASLKMSNSPHITISKTDGKRMLYKSLAFFQEVNYFRRIEVNQLTLVSRYEGKSWDSKHQIELSTSVKQ